MNLLDADILTSSVVNLSADTNWHEYRASDLGAITPDLVPPAACQLRAVRIRTVATQAAALRFGPATGATGGYVARMTVGASNLLDLDGYTVTMGNRTVTFSRTSESVGTVVGLAGKTRAELVTELLALFTAAATGIADLVKAASYQPGTIAFQSPANASAITVSTTAPRSALIAEGFAPGAEIKLATSTTSLEIEVPPAADVRVLALRTQSTAALGTVITIDCYWTRRAV